MAGESVWYRWSSDDDVWKGIVNGDCMIDGDDGAVYVPVFSADETKIGGHVRYIDARNLVPRPGEA